MAASRSWATWGLDGLGAHHPVVVLAQGPERGDDLGLGDDVELAPPVQRQVDMAERLQAAAEARLGLAFAVDEDPAHLGEELRVPRMHAHLRDHLQQTLTPLVNPRTRERVEA